MSTTPNNLLVVHVLRDDTQQELFHYHSWDGGEADWSVVPCVLLAFLKTRVVFLQSSGTSSAFHDLQR